MTDTCDASFPAPADMRPSLLPFDPAQLTAVRVRQSEFAKLCGVSKTAVGKWVQKGFITVGPDGRFDPVYAWRQVYNNSDPARLRARMFKDAIEPVSVLRERIRTLESRLENQKRAFDFRAMDEQARARSRLMALIEANFDALVAAHVVGKLERALDRLSFESTGLDPALYDRDYPEEDEAEDEGPLDTEVAPVLTLDNPEEWL